MGTTKAQEAERAADKKLVAKLHKQGMTSREIAKAIGKSSSTVGRHLNTMGLRPHLPQKTKTVVEPVVVPAPPKVIVMASSRVMSASERVTLEARRKALIKSMTYGPTDEQRDELAAIVRTLEVDYCARQAQRVAA